MKWEWYQNPKTLNWYRVRSDDWLLYNRIGQDGGRGYQVQLQDWVRDHFQNRPHRRAIDIGANMGITAIEYARVFDQVEAFEPVPDVYDQLEQVIAKNQLTNVQAHPKAIGDKEEMIMMKYRANNSFASSRHHKGDQQVQQLTLDSYDFDAVDFIKIDVEGMEPAVISGAWETIKRHTPVILFEYKPHLSKRLGHDIDQEVCERLEQLGYVLKDKKDQPWRDSRYSDFFATMEEAK